MTSFPLQIAAGSLALFVCVLVPVRGANIGVASFDTRFVDLVVDGRRLAGVEPDGGLVRLEIQGGRLAFTPHEPGEAGRRPNDILPDGVVVAGDNHIDRAWLGGATRRYEHAVLGDDLEAARLIVIDYLGHRHVYELPRKYVFEDRFPRLVDMDGDGNDEILVIRSDVRKGSAVAVFKLEGSELILSAASDPIGLRHRWLNVVGAADFDGDGRKEIAVVVTPHIGGTLTLLRQLRNELVPVFERDGFSNHAHGSRELGMSAVQDLNGDGIPDAAVPDARRRSLVLLTLANGRYRELDRIDHSAAIRSGIHAVDLDEDNNPELVYLLENNTLVVVSVNSSR